jgi:hypothetical protein
MELKRIGRRFWQDCVDCCCDVPEAKREGKNFVVIDLHDERIEELKSRAWLYVDPYGPGNDDLSLKAAAKRTLIALGEAA